MKKSVYMHCKVTQYIFKNNLPVGEIYFQDRKILFHGLEIYFHDKEIISLHNKQKFSTL